MIEDCMPENEPENAHNDLEIEQNEPLPKISFHAMLGTTHSQTLKVIRKMKNKKVTILIDGGNTHNFFDQNMTSKLGLPIVRDKLFQVMVGNDEQIGCTSRSLGV